MTEPLDEAASMEVEVSLEEGALPEEVEAVRKAFADLNLAAKVEANYVRRGIGDYPWAILIALPLIPFLKAFGEAAGKDAWELLRDLTGKLYEARKRSRAKEGSPVIVDEDTGLWVILDSEIPADAFEQLLEFDISSAEAKHLQWDPVSRRWYDAWDRNAPWNRERGK